MNKYDETMARAEEEMLDNGLLLVPAKTIAWLVARSEMLMDRMDALESKTTIERYKDEKRIL